jgi:hypothetical protein
MKKTRKKPGPKPKPLADHVKVKSYSYTPETADFLESGKYKESSPGLFIRRLLLESPEFKAWKERS